MMGKIERINIFGTEVSITNIHKAPAQVHKLCKQITGYICLPDAYVIVIATKDKKLQQILNQSLITFPDGSPLVIYAKSKGIEEIGSVSGYWLVKNLLASCLTHYFYGSSDNELKKIKEKLEFEFPSANILGYKSPPMVSLEEIEGNRQIEADIRKINEMRPNIIWVGLNSPKQDYLMAHYSSMLQNSIMVGIGGVYDYLSGTMKISPEWIKKMSLRWVYRLLQNPKRIYKKAFIAIFKFSWLIIEEMISKLFKFS